MRPQSTVRAGLGLALISSVTFATSGTFARSLLGAGWSAEAAVAARVAVAALVLAIPAAMAVRGRWRVLGRNLGPVGLFGLFAVAGAQVGFFNAVRYLPIGVALLLEYFGIVFVVLWMWARHGQRPRLLTTLGSAAALLGLVLVLNLAAAERIQPTGVLWGLTAAVGLATYFVLSARVDGELPAVAFASAGMAIGAGVLFLLGLVTVVPLHATFGPVNFAGLRMSWWIPVVGLSLLAAVVPYVAGIGAARILGARFASFVGLTEVLFAVLIAWLLLDELPTVVQFVGGALVLAGVSLVRADELRLDRKPSRARPRSDRRGALWDPAAAEAPREVLC
ncbi:MAG: EamA family transporter [Micromonosporaceae bacterium]